MSRDGSVETWSRVIVSEADVQALSASAIGSCFSGFPYCVRSPASRGEYGKPPAMLLCLGEGKIVLINDDDPASAPVVMPLESISGLESGRNLLLSWLALYHRGSRFVVWYNSVGYELYEPFINAFREVHDNAEGSGIYTEQSPLEPLFKLDYKYYTRARTVLAGRIPSIQWYHPAVELKRRLFSRRIVSSYLLACTEAMLYVFSEESIVRPRKTAGYSMVVRYIPRNAGLSFAAHGGETDYALRELRAAGQAITSMPVATAEQQGFERFVAAMEASGPGHPAPRPPVNR